MRIITYSMIILFLVSSITLFAQEEAENEKEMKYIFGGKGKTKVSGFGAPIMQFSAIGDEFAFLMGGGGAVLLNQTFYIGAFGEGLTTGHYSQIDAPEVPKGKTRFGYGGFWLGYIHKNQKPVHFGVSTRLGWGSIYYDINYNYSYNDYEYQADPTYLDNVFVFVPQLEAEFNFFKWMKMNIGVGYRVVTGIDKTYNEELIFDKKDFNKPQGTITLMFGYFK